MEPQPETAGSARRPAPAGDWPARAADLVDAVVALLRDKTVRPLTLVARAIVFGVLIFAAATVTVTLVSVSLVRLLTVYAFSGRVWASDLLVGGVFTVAGLVAWGRRTARSGSAR